MRNHLWMSVLSAALEDRLDFKRRLEARPMAYATEDEKRQHQARIYATQREIIDICTDIEKAEGQ